MNIDDFKSEIKNGKQILNSLSEFLKELANKNEENKLSSEEKLKIQLEKSKQKRENTNEIQKLEEGNIYGIISINEEKIKLINLEKGYDFFVYISTTEETLEKLNNAGINNEKIYKMSTEEFYKLEEGNNITLKNGECIIYTEEPEIKNKYAWRILESIYFNIEQEEGNRYIVESIDEQKINLKNIDKEEIIKIYKNAYTDFKIGDTIIRKDRKYIKEK